MENQRIFKRLRPIGFELRKKQVKNRSNKIIKKEEHSLLSIEDQIAALEKELESETESEEEEIEESQKSEENSDIDSEREIYHKRARRAPEENEESELIEERDENGNVVALKSRIIGQESFLTNFMSS